MNTLNWSDIVIDDNDLDLIYNRLLEKETPMTPMQLAEALIESRIKAFKKINKGEEKKDEHYYRPEKKYTVGFEIEFPLEEKKGIVESIREAVNPALGRFSVITVNFEDGNKKEYASELKSHKLNKYDYENPDRNLEDPHYVYRKFGRQISKKIASLLAKNDDLVRIGSFWFPQALLTEVNPGYLNLAEAVLEMEEGRPLHTEEILEQLEYPMDSNPELTVFSFNYAMQNDPRFGEVGPVNVVLWTLKEMQPEDVRKVPMTLKFNEELKTFEEEEISDNFSSDIIQDELEKSQLIEPEESVDSFRICLSYPHWKAGTLPLIGPLQSIFPTANETDNVVFKFYDKKTGENFIGWVILSKNYVCGLKPWYRANGIIPGSMFKVNKTDDSGVIELELIPPRSSKDWIRSFNLDDKNHFSFITNQHKITTDFDERMVIYVENTPQLDTFWETNNRKEANITRQIELVFRELAKDNPQGILHFNEIYAGINMLRRIPPHLLYAILLREDTIKQIDQMYFKMSDKNEE